MSVLPYRTHSELMGLLAEVDEVLCSETPPGNMYVLYVIGGAAIGGIIGGRLTQDVDVVAGPIPPQVLEASRIVARRHGMADNWINDDAGQIIDADLPSTSFGTVYEGSSLLVRAADPETLLALKLLSGRGKDIQDILDLAEFTGIVYYDDLMALCDSTFSANAAYRHERDWVSSVCRDIHSLLADKRSGKGIRERLTRLVDEYDGRT